MQSNKNGRLRNRLGLWLSLLGCLICSCSTPSATQIAGEAGKKGILEAIETTTTPGRTTITMTATPDVRTDRKSYTLTSPPRICVDISGTPAGSLPRQIALPEGPVEKILVQDRGEGLIGVVAYIRPEEYKYQLTPEKGKILLTVTSTGTDTFPVKEVGPAETGMPARPILKVEIIPLTENRSRLAIRGERLLDYEKSVEGTDLLIDLKNGFVPPNQLKSLESESSHGAVRKVSAFTDSGDQHVLLRVSLRMLVPFMTARDGNSIFVDFDALPGSYRTSDAEHIPQNQRPSVATVSQKKESGPEGASRLSSEKKITDLGHNGKDVQMKFQERLQAFAGDKYSFDFRNMDVRNFLQLISEIADINIVWGEDVEGKKVSMSLTAMGGVPWDQALEMVLKPNGLTYQIENDVLWVVPRAKLYAIEAAENARKTKLLAEKRALEAMETKSVEAIPLKNRQAYDVYTRLMGGTIEWKVFVDGKLESRQRTLTPLLPSAGGKGLSAAAGGEAGGAAGKQESKDDSGAAAIEGGGAGGGAAAGVMAGWAEKDLYISYDNATNQIIVNATRKKIEQVKELIQLIDIPAKQVLIEARIVEATTGFTRDLGIQWQSLNKNAQGTHDPGIERKWYDSSGKSAFGGSFSTNSPAGWAANIGLAFGWLTNGGLGSLALDASLALAETDSTAKVISAPKVLTVNGEPAFISRGETQYFPVGTQNSIDYKEIPAVLSLQVIPTVSADDSRVTLAVEVTDDKPTPQKEDVDPDTGKRTLSSAGKTVKKVLATLVVNNGDTVVIGGIYQEEETTVDSGIPLLMDIPILGWLFKTQTKEKAKRELLIFLTPSVVKGSSTKAL